MKSLSLIFLITPLMLSLTGCGSDEDPQDPYDRCAPREHGIESVPVSTDDLVGDWGLCVPCDDCAYEEPGIAPNVCRFFEDGTVSVADGATLEVWMSRRPVEIVPNEDVPEIQMVRTTGGKFLLWVREIESPTSLRSNEGGSMAFPALSCPFDFE